MAAGENFVPPILGLGSVLIWTGDKATVGAVIGTF